MKRLFIEIDNEDKGHLETLSTLACYMFKEKESKKKKIIFDTVIDHAWHDSNLFQAVKDHDQLFVSSSLIYRPSYGEDRSSGALMNFLMSRAILFEVKGKELYFFQEFNQIHWKNLDMDRVEECFKYNKLFVRDENYDNWIEVDIPKLVNKFK